MRIVYRGKRGLHEYNDEPRFDLKSDDGKIIRLPPAEFKVLLAIMGRQLVTNDLLVEVLWPDPDKMALTATQVIRCHMLRLRKKLSGSKWSIINRRGIGWSLTEAA